MLSSYPTVLLSLLIGSGGFLFCLVDSLGFSTYTVMQCVNKDTFGSSFLMSMSFNFYFIVMFRTFCKMFNSNSNLWAKLFVTRYNVSCRYFVDTLDLVFWEFLSWMHLGFSPNAFSASVEMIVWFFPFNFLMWQIALILQVLNQHCIPESNFLWLLALTFQYFVQDIDLWETEVSLAFTRLDKSP